MENEKNAFDWKPNSYEFILAWIYSCTNFNYFIIAVMTKKYYAKAQFIDPESEMEFKLPSAVSFF